MPFFLLMRLVEMKLGITLYKAYRHSDTPSAVLATFMEKNDLEQVGTVLAIVVVSVSLIALVKRVYGWLRGQPQTVEE